MADAGGERPKTVRAFTGWRKIEETEKENIVRAPAPRPEPTPPAAPARAKIREGALDPRRLPRIDRLALERAQAERFAREVAGTDAVPKVEPCKVCGADATNDFFWLLRPEKTRICRACRQSRNRCPHCLDVHRREPPKGEPPPCRACRPGVCRSCGSDRVEGGGRISHRKGWFCAACLGGSRCFACRAPSKTPLPGFPWMLCGDCRVTSLTGEESRDAVRDEAAAFLRALLGPLAFRLPEVRVFSPSSPPEGGFPAGGWLLQDDWLWVPPLVPERFLAGLLPVVSAGPALSAFRTLTPERIQGFAAWLRASFAEHRRDHAAAVLERSLPAFRFAAVREIQKAADRAPGPGFLAELRRFWG